MTDKKPKQQLLSILPKKPKADPTPDKVQDAIASTTYTTPTPEPTPTPTPTPAPKPKKVLQPIKKPAAISTDAHTPLSAVPATAADKGVDGNIDKPQPDHTIFFQAIGVVAGNLRVAEGKLLLIELGGKEYPINYCDRKTKKTREYLIKEVAEGNIKHARLMVYPRATHYPSKEEPHKMSFQMKAYSTTDKPQEGGFSQFKDGDFKLCGLWQFIPVCRTPCISILRNWSEGRKKYIKETTLECRIRFLKASHLPLFWRDAIVPPFRFNPKVDPEQRGRAYFVQLQARFNPRNDSFQFEALAGVPSDASPKFMKARKEEKTELMKLLKAQARAQQAQGKPGAQPPDGESPPHMGNPKSQS